MTSARLLLHEPASGPWNMAVDEALLASAAAGGPLTLRVYRWSEPTLSLGYFQPHDQRAAHTASATCRAVRRATGGGAILHHHDVTYSLTGPIANRLDCELRDWYLRVHAAWITSLQRWGVAAESCPRTDAEREGRFLCFERRAEGDLLLRTRKIGGSAQRRQARAALQHGSLLLRCSAFAPELPGIADLAGHELPVNDWLTDWLTALAEAWHVTWVPGELTRAERRAAEAWEENKYGQRRWTLRR
jgi:lipoate-protein ligase A